MSITLSPELQYFIDSQVAQGAFRDQNELIAEAVRLLRSRQESAEKRAALLADLEHGESPLDQGLGEPSLAKTILTEVLQGPKDIESFFNSFQVCPMSSSNQA